MTALTTFDFDSIIKATAVYQRCTRRRDDRKSLLALSSSMVRMTPISAIKDTVTGKESDSASSLEPRIAEESVDWQEFCDAGFSKASTSGCVGPDDLRKEAPESTPIDSVDTMLQVSGAESNSQRMPSTRLLCGPTLAVDASPRGETSRLSYTDHSIQTHATVSGMTVKDSVQTPSRNANHERIKHKIIKNIQELIEHQHAAPVVSELDIGRQDERRCSSSVCIQEDALASLAEASEPKWDIIAGHFPHPSPTLTEILGKSSPATKDTM
jgi:hypothetical protein